MAKLGLMQFKSMSSLLFVGFRYKNPFSITFRRCNGYLKKYFYIDANEQCIFNLDSEITSGDVNVELLDLKNNIIFTLNSDNKTEILKSDIKLKCKIIFRFNNASGKITFGWN